MTDKKRFAKQQQPSKLGVLLKKTREQKKIAQAELARLAGVSTRTIHALEAGTLLSVRDEVVIRLADALEQPPKEWVIAAGHEYDPQKATLIRQLRSYAERGLVTPKPKPFEEVLQEEAKIIEDLLQGEAEVTTPAARLEIWVIETHQPAEVRDPAVMKVVRDNVQKGVTYRFFYPITATGSRPLEPYWWDQGHKEAIDGIRQAVAQPLDQTDAERHGRVVGYGIEPTEFPIFMYNMGTVIFWKEGNVESEQTCYRVVNVTDPKRAWCFRERTTAILPLIQFLAKKVHAPAESNQASRGSTP